MAEQTPETNPAQAQQPEQQPETQPQQPEQHPAMDLTALQSQLAAAQQLSDQYRQAAINKVLEDIPVLKPHQSEQSKGFQQIGAGGSQSAAQSDELARIFGNKK